MANTRCRVSFIRVNVPYAVISGADSNGFASGSGLRLLPQLSGLGASEPSFGLAIGFDRPSKTKVDQVANNNHASCERRFLRKWHSRAA